MSLDTRKDRPNEFVIVDGKVVAAPVPTTEAQRTLAALAISASGETWKWWGPILRPWAPCPYGASNLREWFKAHWNALPDRAPKP